MITERDLQEAIAECQGIRNPTSSTCIKLAAYLTIKEHLYGEPKVDPIPRYSYAAFPSDVITYDGKTEFAQIINGRKMEEGLPIIEELVETVHVLNPRLYASVMSKFK